MCVCVCVCVCVYVCMYVYVCMCVYVCGEGTSGTYMLTNVRRHAPLRASHNLMVLSREPEIINGPGCPPAFFCKEMRTQILIEEPPTMPHSNLFRVRIPPAVCLE